MVKFLNTLFLIECLIELLVTIVERQPKVCQTSHISTLLSAYSATMTTTGNMMCVCVVKLSVLVSHLNTCPCRPWSSLFTVQV